MPRSLRDIVGEYDAGAALEYASTIPADWYTDARMLELERRGVVLRVRLEGREAWCDRRLLARIQRYTLERLRREIEPVSAAVFLRFLAHWQHADEETKLDGPRGVAEALAQLAGFEAPAAAWERSILPARVLDWAARSIGTIF